MDGLLDLMEADARYRFTLDGQLATLDDYLEVRPEAAERVRRLVDEGRLAIGPWQVLMDEFLVSGETIVRNLEYGQRRGAEFGGAMTVGYLPDMFGHVAQMPQILRQAGIDVAVVWRGVPAAIDSHSFEWESPDGSSVRAEYLPYGYSNGAYLLDVPGQLGRGLEAVRESHREFFGDEPILAMFGTDHMEPVPRLTDLLEESGAAAQVSTLADYLAAVDGRPHQQRWRGELRSSARANMLMGTLSARLDLKAAMARAERALTRYAEPFQALYGTAWPDRLLDLAWRRVIENSAHDSICGCSVDEVSTQVLVRCYEAEQIAMGLAEDTAREAAAAAPMGSVVAFNPSPTARWDNVELSLAVPARWKDIALELPDGTRVAAQRITRNEPLLYEERVPSSGVSEWLRRRLHGRELFARRLNRMIIEGRTVTFEVDEEDDPIWLDLDELKNELEVATSGEDGEWDVRIVASRRSDVVARVPAPALGWTALQPVEGTGSVEDAVQVSPDRLDNGLLSIAVGADGTLSLGVVDGVGRLVDGGDQGDSYNYAPPAEDHLVEAPDEVRVSVVAEGPVRGALSIVRSYRWSPAQVPVDVETTVELRAGEPFCRVRVSFENPIGDHRLRFHVPLPREARFSAAEGQFAVVERGARGRGGIRRGRPADVPRLRLRRRRRHGGAARAPDGVRAGGRRPRAGPDGPPLDRPHQPQRPCLPREPGRPGDRDPGRPVPRPLEHRLRALPARRGLAPSRRARPARALSASISGGTGRRPRRSHPGVWPRAARRRRRPLLPAAPRPSAGGAGRVRASGAGAGPARRVRDRSSAVGDPNRRAGALEPELAAGDGHC